MAYEIERGQMRPILDCPHPLTFAGGNGYLPKQEGRQAQQRPPSRCGARPPMFETSVFAPRLGCTSYRGNCFRGSASEPQQPL